MSLQRASALVIRGVDFSESSRVVTLWTKEFGKARALAKGGRRLKSNFDVALDLLTVCDIVLIRKTSGSLDLLTEARVEERFGQLRHDLAALYAGYYVAEMLSDWTEDGDPHPLLFDEAIGTLRNLGQPGVGNGACLAHFELVLLRELGYGPALDFCADCGEAANGRELAFSASGGGVICSRCQGRHRDRRPMPETLWHALETLQKPGEAWRGLTDAPALSDVRQVLNQYVTYRLGRRPRLLTYLGS